MHFLNFHYKAQQFRIIGNEKDQSIYNPNDGCIKQKFRALECWTITRWQKIKNLDEHDFKIRTVITASTS